MIIEFLHFLYVFKFVLSDSSEYGGGMGIVAASTMEEAESFVDAYSKGRGTEFKVTHDIPSLKSDKKGIIDFAFYIE